MAAKTQRPVTRTKRVTGTVTAVRRGNGLGYNAPVSGRKQVPIRPKK